MGNRLRVKTKRRENLRIRAVNYSAYISVIFHMCRNSTVTFPFSQEGNSTKYRVFASQTPWSVESRPAAAPQAHQRNRHQGSVDKPSNSAPRAAEPIAIIRILANASYTGSAGAWRAARLWRRRRGWSEIPSASRWLTVLLKYSVLGPLRPCPCRIRRNASSSDKRPAY